MDNFHVDITAEGKSSLAKAIGIAFAHNAPGCKSQSYAIKQIVATEFNGLPVDLNGKRALVLRWTKRTPTDPVEVCDLACGLDAEATAHLAGLWLDEQDYGREPDHDGDNGKGWRVFVGGWGHVAGDHYSICAVTPAWAMYGK
ncbi:MAG: hypothetical protein DI549_00655 [Ancylobacter novellus]|uniref:Uncharacterized protein n=1 Tax=Ancylobacter novellus TaxID=921 RepID=A0A2W5RGQ6_ANCNO|nr:MAG: hypothetical protein DI549_00655 [Ancylobacter novellus]